MRTDLYKTLTLLRNYLRQMSIADKHALVSNLADRLAEDMLKTSDGVYTFSDENIMCVALGVIATDTRDDFERVCGFYGGGYKSALR